MIKEKYGLIRSFYFPLLFVLLMWLVKLLEFISGGDFTRFGVFPRKIAGLIGVLFSPFIHGDWMHLFNNSLPVLFLGAVLFYFYKPVAYKVFFLIYFISNIWLWALGRPAYHIGASGIVYGLATFIFFSGIFRRHIPLMVLSLLVTFLYGSLVWGIFPISYRISFEGHLTGAVAGLILAIMYKKEGAQRKKYEWDEEEDNEADDENAYWRQEPGKQSEIENPKREYDIEYHYKPKD